MTATAESITRAEAIPLLLEVAEARVELRCRQYVEIRVDPGVWREVQTWANGMRAVLYAEKEANRE